MEERASREQHQRRKQAGGIRPSQVGLVAEEEHGLCQEGQELQRGSKGFDPEGDDDPQPDQVHRRGGGGYRRGQT